MTAHTCACCDDAQSTDSDRWLGDAGLDGTLPEDLQVAFGEFFGTGRVETLDECADRFRELLGGDVAVDDLCSTTEETGHRARVDGETYHFRCFYDAVLLAALRNRPVDIRTESPDGTVIEARARGEEGVQVTPGDAVFSVGLDDSSGKGEPTLEDGYAAICPYVKAFPSREAYHEWARTTRAPTVGLPFAGATEFATALLG